MLLDSDGHVKVTDFGLAKGNITDDIRTNSFIGTMEYMVCPSPSPLFRGASDPPPPSILGAPYGVC